MYFKSTPFRTLHGSISRPEPINIAAAKPSAIILADDILFNSFLIIHLVSRKKDLRQNRSAKGLASFTANAANVRCQHSSCAVGDRRMGNP